MIVGFLRYFGERLILWKSYITTKCPAYFWAEIDTSICTKSYSTSNRSESDEVIDMFVERIIYRGVVDGNDEFVWVMNLSGECTDTFAKYKIRGYDKDYADSNGRV